MEQQQTNSQFEQIANEKITETERIAPMGDLLKKSFRIFKQGASKFLSMTLLVPLLGMMPLVIVGLLYLLSTYLGDGPAVLIFQIILGLLAFISILFFLYVLYISTIGMYVLLRDFSPDLKVKEAFKRARPYFLEFIIVNFFVGILVIFWSLLFIIPGIIVSVYYSFAIWTLIFEDYKGMSALKRSKELVKGHWWSVFSRLLIFGLIHLVIILVLSIPFVFIKEGSVLEFIWNFTTSMLDIIISIVFAIYSYLIYKDLVRIKGESQIEKKKGGKKIIIVAIILGLFISLSIIIFVSLDSIKMIDRDANRVSDIETIQTELEIYYDNNGHYPIRLNNLLNLESSVSANKLSDPQSHSEYKYMRDGFNSYELCFELEEDGSGYIQGENCVTSEDYRSK